MIAMGLRRRVAWMVRGPEYFERLQVDVREANQRIDQLQAAQDRQLDQIRESVSDALDDVMARVELLDQDAAADQS